MIDFFLIFPEIVLALTMGLVALGEVSYHGERRRLILPTALLGLAGALVQVILAYRYGASYGFNQAIAVDGLALLFKSLFILATAIGIGVVWLTQEIEENKRSEYAILAVGACIAACVSSSASDLVLMFLSLQFLNVLTVLIAGIGKRSTLSVEAAAKQMIFSGVSSAFMIYGGGLLFAEAHSLNIHEISKFIVATPMSIEKSVVSFGLIGLGLSFQLGAFPMFFSVPDMLEGAPTPSSAFLAVISRGAGFAIAIRLLLVVFAQPGSGGQWQVVGLLDWPKLMSWMAGLTLVIGSVLAYRQTGAKRLLGYFTLTQSGFLLMGILVLDQLGVTALLYSLVVELFALMGAYYVMSRIWDGAGTDRISRFQELSAKKVPETLGLIIFLFTLAGVPPTPGFIGKFLLISSAIHHRQIELGIVGVIAMVISMAAAIRLTYGLTGHLRESLRQGTVAALDRTSLLFLSLLVAPIFLITIFTQAILNWAGKSLGFIFW